MAPLLGAAAFTAGFFDAIVGGGGLIQLPALLVLLPGVPVSTLLGTNKLASLAGTSVAATQYARRVRLDWPAVGPAALTAFVFSALGARAASLVRPETLRPVILVLLVCVAAYVARRKDFGADARAGRAHPARGWHGVGVGAGLGFYDGLFGPGTGSFLVFTFIGLFGLNFLSASASAKIVNAATNLSATLYFAWTGHILYPVALLMASCNVLGSLLGTRLAVLKGSGFVRALFLAVMAALILKFGWDVLAAPKL